MTCLVQSNRLDSIWMNRADPTNFSGRRLGEVHSAKSHQSSEGQTILLGREGSYHHQDWIKLYSDRLYTTTGPLTLVSATQENSTLRWVTRITSSSACYSTVNPSTCFPRSFGLNPSFHNKACYLHIKPVCLTGSPLQILSCLDTQDSTYWICAPCTLSSLAEAHLCS